MTVAATVRGELGVYAASREDVDVDAKQTRVSQVTMLRPGTGFGEHPTTGTGTGAMGGKCQ